MDLDKAKTAMPALFAKMAFYTNGDQLKNNIPADLYKKTRAKLKDLGAPYYMFYKPWYAAFFIIAKDARTEMGQIAGIDSLFYKKAKLAGKTIVGLETAKQQVDLFAHLNKHLQIEFLKNVISETGKEQGKVEDLMAAYWKTGNVEAIKTQQSRLFPMQNDLAKQIKQVFIKDRNKKWVKEIKNLFKKKDTPFIIVGLYHLIGDHSVLDMLRNEGFRVEQM